MWNPCMSAFETLTNGNSKKEIGQRNRVRKHAENNENGNKYSRQKKRSPDSLIVTQA